VQSKFDLSNYLGQRVRIRWIAQSWEFDQTTSSYEEYGGSWVNLLNDDGCGFDDINVTGAIQSQATPVADVKTPLAGSCPATCNPAVETMARPRCWRCATPTATVSSSGARR